METETFLASRGISYGVSHPVYLEETLASARSVRAVMPDLPLALAVDEPTLAGSGLGRADLEGLFDRVRITPGFAHWRSPKFHALLDSPFRETLYLDGDTYVTAGLSDLFDLLSRFELALMPAPQRLHRRSVDSGLLQRFKPVPLSFPEFNTGVFLYRNNRRMRRFIRYWIQLFEKGLREVGYEMDQATFRIALYHSDIVFHGLGPEYNFRGTVPNVVKDRVRIVHAHGDLPALAERVNRQAGRIRCFEVQNDLVDGFVPRALRDETAG